MVSHRDTLPRARHATKIDKSNRSIENNRGSRTAARHVINIRAPFRLLVAFVSIQFGGVGTDAAFARENELDQRLRVGIGESRCGRLGGFANRNIRTEKGFVRLFQLQAIFGGEPGAAQADDV